jgi:O-antigen/teichoic acid export membrane protein
VARIGVAVGVSSVAGYLLLALVGRALSPAQFGLFVAFWGVLFGLGSSLSTIEQEAARRAASETVEDSGPPASAVTTAAALLAGLVAAATLVPAVSQRVYGESDSRIGLVVVLAALGFAVQFAVRGLLIGSGAVRSYSRLLVVEPAARLVVLALVLILAGVDLRTAALAVGAGSFAWLLWARRAREVLPRGGLSAATWRAAVARAGSLMLGAALTASIITGFPTLVTVLTDGVPGASGGAVFAALTVSRVPLLLVTPIQALAVPFVVRTRERSGADGASRLRRGLALGSLLFAVLGAAAAAVAWVLGPWAVRLVYGAAYRIPAPAIALLVLSACLLAWVQLLSAAFIALSAHRAMLAMWAVGVAGTVVWLLVSPLDVVDTTAVGSLVGPLAAFACALPLLWRLSATRAGAVPRPAAEQPSSPR